MRAHIVQHTDATRRTSSPPAAPFMGGVTSTATLVLLGMFLSAGREKTKDGEFKGAGCYLNETYCSNDTREEKAGTQYSCLFSLASGRRFLSGETKHNCSVC